MKAFYRGDRTILARAITLIESTAGHHHRLAGEVMEGILASTGRAFRLGITGVPGVGKSSFIETLGLSLIDQQQLSIAVLAIDPSSSLRGGSILGDKTRMNNLAREPKAFIRPSPSQGSLGGVHRKTRETMLLCEAAGFDLIIVETVGVGQSETLVADMVDTFLVLMLSGAGDELQGLKKGLLEIADIIAVNKADGENVIHAQRARQSYENALQLFQGKSEDWQPPVLTCSAFEATGISEVWGTVEKHREFLQSSGRLTELRNEQRLKCLHEMVKEELLFRFKNHPEIQKLLPMVERRVLDQSMDVTKAAKNLLKVFTADQ